MPASTVCGSEAPLGGRCGLPMPRSGRGPRLSVPKCHRWANNRDLVSRGPPGRQSCVLGGPFDVWRLREW